MMPTSAGTDADGRSERGINVAPSQAEHGRKRGCRRQTADRWRTSPAAGLAAHGERCRCQSVSSEARTTRESPPRCGEELWHAGQGHPQVIYFAGVSLMRAWPAFTAAAGALAVDHDLLQRLGDARSAPRSAPIEGKTLPSVKPNSLPFCGIGDHRLDLRLVLD